MHLWFGARHPDSDLLYGEELRSWQADRRLTSVTTSFSRIATRTYVQDALRKDGVRVARLIAEGVAETFVDILSPQGLTPAMLKARGRYVEDVY